MPLFLPMVLPRYDGRSYKDMKQEELTGDAFFRGIAGDLRTASHAVPGRAGAPAIGGALYNAVPAGRDAGLWL
jgi:hypothetical protein